jgi:hypothetical protein
MTLHVKMTFASLDFQDGLIPALAVLVGAHLPRPLPIICSATIISRNPIHGMILCGHISKS